MSGIFSAIVVGLVLGYLGRLIVPGKTNLGLFATLLIGLAAAFLAGYVGNRAGWSFPVLLVVEVVFSAIGVALVGGGLRSRSRS